MECGKLRKLICSNKATVENLKQFAERLEEKPIKSSVDDLPNILPAIFNYAFHKDTSFRQSALPAFIKLTNLLDLNKHLKEQQWWSQLKEQMIQKVDILMELITSGDENWSNLWCTTITMLGSDLKGELVLLNKLLKVVEKAFKMSKEDVKDQGFKCWRKLISNFAINKQELNNKRRLTLLVIPLKAGNHATHRLCVSKMETWKYLLYNLDQESEMTVQLVIVHFLEFMFGGVGSLAPACKMLNTECGKAFWQLLKTLFVFRSLPDIFIKYAILCIEHIIENVDLALDIWKCLLNNMKLLQWPDNLVATLVTEIVNSGEKNAVFKKSETYAQLVRNLYTGNQSIPVGLLVKNIDKIITVAFEPDVLLNFTESWCNDLLEIVDQTDPITLPQDVMGIIVPKLIALSTGEVFRDEKVKLLRGIWMTVINIYCKWTFSEGLRDKNGSTQSDLHNIYQLLLYGATDLSSTWNKFQIKSWKSLYSEGVKHFSLLPEADKFVSGLVQLLVDGVRNGKLPFHVAVDVVSILLEFHLSKDASSIRPLMMELAEKGMNLLQIDPSSSILLGTYIKIIVSAARSESALVNDVSAVIDKMSTNSKETLSGGSHDKIRNMVFKAQHQLHGLKSTRIQEKSDSPNTSTTPTSSSPTMTSFLRRLAKSKESKAKLSSTSPSQSLEKSPSPAVTPTSKKTNSPFADLKSEDFVFVPPKNRKTILTDHQKESLNSRKHDIPALYQDLSQDNSQSAFESIVTSVQVVEEDVDKLHFVHTPKKQNGSIELGLKVLTPKEVKNSTSGIEVREPEESKLLSNKENDCFNNNTNSPFSSVGKQDKLVSKDMSSFNTVLPNDDSKKCEDNSLAVVVDGNKPLQEMKNVESKLSDNKKSSNIKTCESTLKEVSKRDKKENEDLKTSVEKSECKKTSEIEPCSKANKTVSESLATETTVNSVIDHKTPKRNFKRSKIILSVKKSQKKDNTKSPKISEEEISLTPDNKERKSPRNSNNTPKVSPRRLRKRKSGVTPILSAGELSKKKKSVQSPLSSKTTPVVKIAECTEIKKAFNEDSEDVNNCNRNKCIGSTNGINSEKPCMVTSEESSTGTKSVVGEECEKTDKISEKLIMKKDNINVDIKFSPVKVVLARIPLNDSSSCNNINNRLCGPSSEKPNKSCGEPVSGRIKDPIKLSDRKNQVDDSTEGLINADTSVDHSKKNSHSVIGNNTETEGSVKEVTTNLKEVRKGDEEISVKCTVATKSNTSEQKTHEDICTNSESKQSAEIEQTPPVKRRYSPLIITRSMETNNKSIDTSHTSGKNYTTTKNVSSGDTSIKVPVECSAAVTTVKSEAENSNDCNKLYDSANKDGKSLLDKESISTPQKSVVELKTNSTAGGNNDMKNSSKESESLCVVESSPSQNTRSSVKKQSADYSDSDIEVIYDAKDNTNKINTGIVESEEIIEEVTPVKEINKLPTSLQNKNNLSKSKIIVDEQQTIEIEKDENSSSMSVVCKHISSSNTPIKSGQKGLKQTQLPFVPVRPSLEANVDKPINLNENGNTICDTTNLKNVTSQMTSASETKEENNLDSITCGVETDKDRETFKAKKEETQLGCEVEGTRINQEAPRTPEKNKPVEESSGLENLKTTDDSLVECKDSEDVIASSQEDEFNTRSFSVLNGPITSSSPLKLPSKSPKKHENASFSQIHLSSERVLRSSPLKVENSRFSGTPIKKSVCRRLDVEISENQSEVESTEAANGGIAKLKISSSHTEDQTINQPQVTLSRADYSEEFLNDIKLLNGDRKKPDEIYDSGSDKNDDIDKLKLFEKYQPNGISTITSPSSHKTLKRFLLEPTSSTVESSRTTLGSLRLENNVTGSPKSPSSRTNQMMELAMQDKEKTISSPVSSLKKRKINPLRLGPVLKTPLNQSVTRALNGPSEDWVRRTYSPTASPNSSILKRRADPQPLSPDCSPPSNKKKRVSFLDPPVSESLLFCKRTPGKGQIQRPEPKQESESEDVPSQGSVQLICPVDDAKNQLQASVYSPLKQCSDPLSTVLERIVSVQWASELESQLLRLGVTTVGQLSALTGATVERLPFIPPKLERLRKILQNYDNEINEREESSKTECMSLDEEEECVTPPIDEISNAIAPSEEAAPSEFEASTKIPLMAGNTSSMAEQIKSSIESNPDLISELGQRLDVDIIMSILKCAVTKLKTQDDTR